MDTCVVDGCENLREIREYFQRCYNRLWKLGELPERGSDSRSESLPETRWKSVPKKIKNRKMLNSIQLSYEEYQRNYRLCASVDQRLYWRDKMKECVRQIQEMALSGSSLSVPSFDKECVEGLHR